MMQLGLDLILPVVGMISGVIFLTWFTYNILAKHPFGSKSASKKFFKLVDKQLELNLLKDKTDIIALAESFAREKVEKYDITHLLEDYLRHSITEQGNKSNYQIIKTILDAENEEKPFADVPDLERGILRFLKNTSDNNEEVDKNLKDLGHLISSSNKQYIKIQKLNRISIPVAIVSLLATIFFGYMSYANSVTSDEIEEVIKKTFIENSQTL